MAPGVHFEIPITWYVVGSWKSQIEKNQTHKVSLALITKSNPQTHQWKCWTLKHPNELCKEGIPL